MLKLTDFEIDPFTSENCKNVYDFIQNYNRFYYIPFNYFKRATIDDPGHDNDLNLVVKEKRSSKLIAVFLSTLRVVDTIQKCFIKVFLISKEFRRIGLGSIILDQIIRILKEKGIPILSYGASAPIYWEPGLDLRHTDLYFFLKTHKFREKGLRYNLTVELDRVPLNPKKQMEDYEFMRASPEDIQELYNFVKANFPSPVWPEEVKASFDFDPPNTYIAKDIDKKIIGWATHSNFYPGSFGPTGVLPVLWRKGIGKELLYWCLYDIKAKGLDICTIMWVDGDTRKYYSKTTGAYIHPIYSVIEKKIK